MAIESTTGPQTFVGSATATIPPGRTTLTISAIARSGSLKCINTVWHVTSPNLESANGKLYALPGW
jgi:hypothetical protein